MTVLLVAHGSSDARSRAASRTWAERVRAGLAGERVELCWLGHASPSPAQAVRVLADDRDVCVQPLLLLPGAHSNDDVPGIAAHLAARPGVAVCVGQPVGAAPELLEAVCRAVGERGAGSALLAFSGTTRAAGRAAAAGLASQLAARLRPLGVAEVQLGFVGSGSPGIAEARRRLTALGHGNPLVVPWFVSDGHVRRSLEPDVDGLDTLPPLGHYALDALAAATITALTAVRRDRRGCA